MENSATPCRALQFRMFFWMPLTVDGIGNSVPIDSGSRTITRTTEATTGYSQTARSKSCQTEFGSNISNNIWRLLNRTSNSLASLNILNSTRRRGDGGRPPIRISDARGCSSGWLTRGLKFKGNPHTWSQPESALGLISQGRCAHKCVSRN
jgi:hypothetical protein